MTEVTGWVFAMECCGLCLQSVILLAYAHACTHLCVHPCAHARSVHKSALNSLLQEVSFTKVGAGKSKQASKSKTRVYSVFFVLYYLLICLCIDNIYYFPLMFWSSIIRKAGS